MTVNKLQLPAKENAVQLKINEIIDNLGGGGANTDLSNLTATGEAHFQEPLVSGTNIKTINNISLLGSGNINTSEIFIAEYGVTSFADIETAYNAGKILACAWNDTSTNEKRVSINVYMQIVNGNYGFYFNFVGASDSYTLYILSSNQWSLSSFPLQRTSTAVTHPANTQVGSSYKPVYINSSGVATACTYGIKTIYTSGTSGYVIYSNGFCVQWGKSTSKTSGSQAVSLSKTYANTNYQIQTSVDDTSTGAVSSAVISEQTSSSFSIIIVRANSSASGQRALDFNWLAMGQLASGQY